MKVNSKDEIRVLKSIAGSLGLLKCREILSAWAGEKVSRIASNSAQLKMTRQFLDELGLHYYISPNLIFAKRDIGKGGWSNKFDERKNLAPEKGDHLIYISNSLKKLNSAVKADLNDDEGEFGIDLGIPECCISFYLNNQDKAFKKQNDFVPLVAQNTNGLHSFNFWNNYISQYFDYSFLSFFPCSFNCKEASKKAQRSYNLMHSVLSDEANQILHFQKQPILYSEYRGVFLFDGAEQAENRIDLEKCVIHSTLKKNSKTLDFIRSVKTITVHSKEKIQFTLSNGKDKIIKNPDWVMGTFI